MVPSSFFRRGVAIGLKFPPSFSHTPVVVSLDADDVVFAYPVKNFAGVGTEIDPVASRVNNLRVTFPLPNGLEGVDVAVDIGNQQGFHKVR